MQCTSCGLHSENLREYSRAIDLGDHRKTIDTILLCAACRVFNAINPKYVAKRIHREMMSTMPSSSGEWDASDKQSVRERNVVLSSGV